MADDVEVTTRSSSETTHEPVVATEVVGRGKVQHFHHRGPRTAVVTSASMSDAASASVVAANGDRAGLVVTNESDGVLYLKEGTGASSTSYTYAVLPGERHEFPVPCYTGAVEGRLASGASNAQARITERTW
jgi:hypothetical protein